MVQAGCGSNVKFFRLIPVETDNEEWECSIIKEELIVEAENEEEARERAVFFTKTAVAKKLGKNIPAGPWYKKELVKAEEISEIPDGFPEERTIYKDDPMDKLNRC